MVQFRTPTLWLLLLIVTFTAAWYSAAHPMDFRVYHFGARGVFDGSRPVYGASSGLGWPMHYRYPPISLLLFAPFAALSLGVGAAVWTGFKVILLAAVMRMVWPRLPRPSSGSAVWLIPVLLAGPFVIQELKYGNAQLFVFLTTLVGLLGSRKSSVGAGAALGFGIAVKVWPLFFLPFLAVRRDGKTIAWTLLFATLLTLLPSFYFGLGRNVELLGQWASQEFATQAGEEEIWFPSQSLRGVMMRYLTLVDYSKVPDGNYRQIQVATMNPATVRAAWAVAAGIIYSAFLLLAYSRFRTDGRLEIGLGFALLALLEPFTQKYALVVLLWPALLAGRSQAGTPSRYLVYASIVLALIQPLIPGSDRQRLMQVLGFDFAVTALLAVALIVTTYSSSRSILLNLE